MPFSFALTGDNNQGIFLPRYFKYDMYLLYGKTSENLQRLNLNFSVCTRDHFPNMNESLFYDLRLDTNFCQDKFNVTIGGAWTESYIQYLSFDISMCKNTTESSYCAPVNEIEDLVIDNSLYWVVTYLDTNINAQISKPPIFYGVHQIYKTLRVNITKLVDISVKRQSLESDDGFIVKSLNYFDKIGFAASKSDEMDMDHNKIFANFIIKATNDYTIYHRSYMKIQQVLANVGGLANIMRIFFIILCFIFSVTRRDETVLNQLFEFDFNEKSSRKTSVNIERDDLKIKQNFPISNDKMPNIKINHPNALHDLEIKNSPEPAANESKNMIHCFTDSPVNVERKISNSFSTKFKGNYVPKVNKSQNFELPHAKVINETESHDSDRNKDTAEKNKEEEENPNPPKTENNRVVFHEIINQEKNTIGETEKLNSPSKSSNYLEKANTRKEKYELTFSLCEVIRMYICCGCYFKKNKKLDGKKRLYERSKDIVEEYLDIANYVHKLDEIERLKIVVLDEMQLALFDFICKEFLSVNEDSEKTKDINKFKEISKNNQKINNLINSFNKKIKDNENVTEIDRKLYKLMLEEFK